MKCRDSHVRPAQAIEVGLDQPRVLQLHVRRDLELAQRPVVNDRAEVKVVEAFLNAP